MSVDNYCLGLWGPCGIPGWRSLTFPSVAFFILFLAASPSLSRLTARRL